jgi:hypothetical protein
VDLPLARRRPSGSAASTTLTHHRRDVQTSAVTFDVRNDRLVRHPFRDMVGIDGDLLAFGAGTLMCWYMGKMGVRRRQANGSVQPLGANPFILAIKFFRNPVNRS